VAVGDKKSCWLKYDSGLFTHISLRVSLITFLVSMLVTPMLNAVPTNHSIELAFASLSSWFQADIVHASMSNL
jgi:hypothetical protein